MKYLIIIALVLFVVSLVPYLVIAQPSLPSAPSQAPIDGGIGILAAAGGAYAIKKIRNRKNSEDSV